MRATPTFFACSGLGKDSHAANKCLAVEQKSVTASSQITAVLELSPAMTSMEKDGVPMICS
jgi:uncharacterized metal-binding protein